MNIINVFFLGGSIGAFCHGNFIPAVMLFVAFLAFKETKPSDSAGGAL